MKSPNRIFNPEDLDRKIVEDKLVLFTDIMLGGVSKNIHCTYDVNSEISSFKPMMDSDSSANQILALRQRPIGRLGFDINLENTSPKLGSRSIFSISPNFTGNLIYYRIDIITLIYMNKMILNMVAI